MQVRWCPARACCAAAWAGRPPVDLTFDHGSSRKVLHPDAVYRIGVVFTGQDSGGTVALLAIGAVRAMIAVFGERARTSRSALPGSHPGQPTREDSASSGRAIGEHQALEPN